MSFVHAMVESDDVISVRDDRSAWPIVVHLGSWLHVSMPRDQAQTLLSGSLAVLHVDDPHTDAPIESDPGATP